MIEKVRLGLPEVNRRAPHLEAPMQWTCVSVVCLARLGSHGRELRDVPSRND